MSDAPARAFDVRHLQLARALFALLAAVMITFSPDHSASVGLSVFSGFAIATGLVLLLSAWLVFRAGDRWPAVVLGILTVVAGMASGGGPGRTTTLFFALVIVWALTTGLAELLAGTAASRRARAAGSPAGDTRDSIVLGSAGMLLGLALLLVPAGYQLEYFIDDAGSSGQWFTLTGITIGVGLFGAYAAIVGIYLAIAGFSPRRADTASVEDAAPAAVVGEPGRTS